jgi:hypothetical protein
MIDEIKTCTQCERQQCERHCDQLGTKRPGMPGLKRFQGHQGNYLREHIIWP